MSFVVFGVNAQKNQDDWRMLELEKQIKELKQEVLESNSRDLSQNTRIQELEARLGDCGVVKGKSSSYTGNVDITDMNFISKRLIQMI